LVKWTEVEVFRGVAGSSGLEPAFPEHRCQTATLLNGTALVFPIFAAEAALARFGLTEVALADRVGAEVGGGAVRGTAVGALTRAWSALSGLGAAFLTDERGGISFGTREVAETGAVAESVDVSAMAGYRSFPAAKRALGSPGQGNVFDNVVEQSQIGRSGFSPEEIHHPFNMNPVAAETNQLKANYYSTKQFFTNGGTVRDWLSGQSFADQYEFGMDVLIRVERGLPLP
jgi:hypothetical protein